MFKKWLNIPISIVFHLWEFNEFPSVWLQATSTQVPPILVISSSALCGRMWPSQLQAAVGAFPPPEFSSSLIVPRQWWEWLQSSCWRHLSVYDHWSRATVYQGWQWGRSSGSSLSGRGPFQLSPGNLGGICRSWSCDDATTGITSASQVLPVLAEVAVALRFLGLSQSGWHVCGRDAKGKPPGGLARYRPIVIWLGNQIQFHINVIYP